LSAPAEKFPPVPDAVRWPNAALGRTQNALLALWEAHHAIDNDVAKYYVLLAIAALAEGAAGQGPSVPKATPRDS